MNLWKKRKENTLNKGVWTYKILINIPPLNMQNVPTYFSHKINTIMNE